MGDHMIRIDQLNIVREVDIGREDSTFTFFFQGQCDFIAIVQLEDHALEVQQDVNDVFLHTIE